VTKNTKPKDRNRTGFLTAAAAAATTTATTAAAATATTTTTFHQKIHIYTHLYRNKNKIMHKIYIR